MTDPQEPAFPSKFYEEPNTFVSYPGIDLRTYLAAKAMQGLLASPMDEVYCDESKTMSGTTFRQEVARWSVMYADALITELNKGE